MDRSATMISAFASSFGSACGSAHGKQSAGEPQAQKRRCGHRAADESAWEQERQQAAFTLQEASTDSPITAFSTPTEHESL